MKHLNYNTENTKKYLFLNFILKLTGCSGPKENASCVDQNKENQCFENETEGKINVSVSVSPPYA